MARYNADDGEETESSIKDNGNEKNGGTASLTTSVLNLVNNIVGAGLFSIPWVMKEASIVTGCLFLAMIAVLNAASFILIGYCCELAGTFQYLEIGRRALGKRFGLLSQLIVNAYAVGSLISFVVLTGDFLIGAETGILSVWANNTIFYQQVEDPDGTVRCSWSSRCFVLYLIAVAIFLPLSLLRKIERLKATSAISLISTIYAGILTVTVYVTQNPNALLPQERAHHVQPEWFDINVHLWSAIPIMNVAFTAHYNAPRFYEELADRSIRRFVFVVALALGFSLAVYASVGVCGYLTFGSLTLGDVLRNFSSTYELAVLARLALAFTVIMTFPFAHHSVRRGVIALYFGDGKNTDNIEFGSLLKITLIIVFASTTIGVLATKVEVVLAYKGAIFGSLMVYILPPITFAALKLRQHRTVSANANMVDYETGSGGGERGMLLPAEDGAMSLPRKVPSFGEALCSLVGCSKGALHFLLLLLFIWGVSSGVISVVITILTQAGIIHGGE
eukprot:g3777.t1